MPTTPASLVDVRAIVQLHEERNRAWHREPPVAAAAPPGAQWMTLVEALHAANFALWHAEDEARRPGASDAAVAQVKRQIDRMNQIRNDTAEAIDASLLAALGEGQAGEQHSETPGMIIDRLSILSLKLFHTEEELLRPGAPEGHAARNAERLAILKCQRDDLAACLERLWADVCAGRRFFRRYYQLKMYNDPELNPILYEKKQNASPQGG